MGSIVCHSCCKKWRIVYDTGYHDDDNDHDDITHRCNIWDIVKISDTQVIYLCALCKRKVAISDKNLFGLDIVALIDLGEDGNKKVYPDKNQREIKEENLNEWK
jgi:hypothetical protein